MRRWLAFADRPKRGKGAKWTAVADGRGVPLAHHLDSASPHAVTLVKATLDLAAVLHKGPGRPQKTSTRLIDYVAADSEAAMSTSSR